MKQGIYWLKNGDPNALLIIGQGKHDPDDPDFKDGCWIYRITASDELTWLTLCVRIKPEHGRVPEAHDISLHTNFHDDPKGDRWLDYTSSLMGRRFVGYIGEFAWPTPDFWSELEEHFHKYDAEARAAYTKDKAAEPPRPSQAEIDLRAALERSTQTIGLANAYGIEGRNGNDVIIDAPDIETAIANYRAYVDSNVAKLDAGGAVKPVYEIDTINHIGPITIIR